MVECHERSHVGGRGPEADVAVGADQHHAAGRDPSAEGIDTGVARDLNKLRPASVQLREHISVCDRSKHQYVV